MDRANSEMGSASSSGAPSWLLATLHAALILAPYTAAGLPFRTSLYVQAVVVLSLTLLLLAAGWARRGPQAVVRAVHRGRIAAAPLVGFALYACGTGWGTLTAILSDNDATLLAGQLLSLGLAPLAGLAGLLTFDRPSWRPSALGIAIGACAATLIHLLHWSREVAHGNVHPRLFLANGVSIVGPSLLALLMVLALLHSPPQRPRKRGLLCAGLSLVIVYIVGSGVRSLWLVALASVVAFYVLGPGLRAFKTGPALASIVVVLGIGTASIVLIGQWLEKERPNLLQIDSVIGGASSSPAFTATIGHAYRLSACRAPTGPERYTIQVQWSGLRRTAGDHLTLPRNRGPLCRSIITLAPEDTRLGRVTLTPKGGPKGGIQDLRVEHLGPGAVTQILVGVDHLSRRATSLVDLFTPNHGKDDETETILFRLRESRRLIEIVAAAPWHRKLIGHGLGARYEASTWGYDSLGNWVFYDRVNYIHNFYAFLIYKLGLIGGGMVLAALLLFSTHLIRSTLKHPQGAERTFFAAASAAWIGYCVWSVASPELINFRTAPLWGLTVAATARVSPRSLAAPPDQ